MMIMRLTYLSLFGFLMSALSVSAQEPDYAVLDSVSALKMGHQCSRWAPIITGTWNPSSSDIANVESNLGKISEIVADSCCLLRGRIKEPRSYLRQYVGVEVDGKRLIYVNAFARTFFDDWPSQVPKPDWRKEPIIPCDGGDDYWGVLFDPSTSSFFDLAINGVG